MRVTSLMSYYFSTISETLSMPYSTYHSHNKLTSYTTFLMLGILIQNKFKQNKNLNRASRRRFEPRSVSVLFTFFSVSVT